MAHIRSLKDRIAVLESQVRRFKASGGVLICLIGVALLVGQGPTGKKTIEAERFVLRDSAGKKRGVWTTNAAARAGLTLFDSNQAIGTAVSVFLMKHRTRNRRTARHD